MAQLSNGIEIFIETGKKRTFAGALAWPGWCRSRRDETAALQALCDYGTRYARVLTATQLDFLAPHEPSAFVVVERMAGDASTDFGAPGKIPISDTHPVSPVELSVCRYFLQVCWNTFDIAAGAARAKRCN